MPKQSLPARAALLLLLTLLAGPSSALQEPGGPPQADPASPAPTRYALVGAIVHSMLPGEEPAPRTVIVSGSTIEALLDPSQSLDEELTTVDLDGLHLIPGLIDGHVNHDLEHDALYVSRGVTLVRDTGNIVHDILLLRTPQMRALVPGPDLYICGPALGGGNQQDDSVWGLPSPRAATEVLPRKLDELAARAKEVGVAPDLYEFDYLYFRGDLRAETAAALCTMAHSRGLTVWGPLPSGGDLGSVLASGQDGLVGLGWTLPAGKRFGEVTLDDLEPAIAALAETHTAVTPLLATTARQLDPPADLEGELARLGPVYDASWKGFAEAVAASGAEHRSEVESILALQRAVVHELWKRGTPLVPGSGAPFELLLPGDGLLDELDQWVLAGIPSGEVLRLATYGAAEALGLEGRRGCIAPGAVADLVALGSDPTGGSLAALRDPELVVVRGGRLERWDLEERLTALTKAQREAREALVREIEIPPPDMPTGELLLEGRTQSEVDGLRLSAEHFAVVDLLDGRTAYGTRMVLPGAGVRPEFHVHLVEIFKGDKLVSFQLLAEPAEEQGADPEQPQSLAWKVEGTLIGDSNRMSITRSHSLAHFATVRVDQPLAFVDYSDTLTALILARHARAGTREKPEVFYPLHLEGNYWEPVQDQWYALVSEENHAVLAQSPETSTVVISGVNERGVPILFQRRTGTTRRDLRVFSDEGPGAPPKKGRVLDTK